MKAFVILWVVLLVLTGCDPVSDPEPSTPPAEPTTTTDGSASPTTEQQMLPSDSAQDPVTTTSANESLLPCAEQTVFEYPPVDLEAIEYIVPFGLMFGSHVTPVDHQYFQNFLEPDRAIDVYSPAAGKVVSMQHFGTPVSENPEGIVGDYRIVIEHACDVSSIFIHIDELIPRLALLDPGVGNYTSIDVDVAAGEKLGIFTENVDYNVVDQRYTVEGLIDPASYDVEPWKIHVPDTFAYFTPEIRQRLEARSLRTPEPRAGRFAYDIDGRLVGNWFQTGTNGYGGTDPQRYWAGHLTFAYDHLDPSMIVVSIGTFEGRSRQFAVLGNAPDPAEVAVGSEPVVLELVEWDYTVDGEHWDRRTLATGIAATPGSTVHGVIAVQLIDQRELQIEILPGATAADFQGFTSNAIVYTR
jgi:hypothetical protein